jgi:hypothetical protein
LPDELRHARICYLSPDLNRIFSKTGSAHFSFLFLIPGPGSTGIASPFEKMSALYSWQRLKK